MDTSFGKLMAMAIFEAERENDYEEAKKVVSFMKLNCFDKGFILETPYSKQTRACAIAKYITEHLDEFE